VITHVAVFKWKPGFPEAELNEWSDRLRSLPRRIERLRSLDVGNDRLHGDRSWQTAVVTVLDNMQGLDDYVHDAEHQAIIKISAPHIDQLAQVVLSIVKPVRIGIGRRSFDGIHRRAAFYCGRSS
jgi:hypothetical protein